jgi:hypothetical protein
MNHGLTQWLPFTRKQAWYQRYFNNFNSEYAGMVWPALGGVALGAGLMYILDPDRGSSRRAYTRDKVTSAVNKTGRAIGKKSRDIKKRAHGIVAETGSFFRGSESREAVNQ